MFAKDNQLLTIIEFENITRSPRGSPQIEVSFEIDIDNVLIVNIVEQNTQNSKTVTIPSEQMRFTFDEVDEAFEAAAKAADEDKHKFEWIELQQMIDNYIYVVRNV